MMANIITREILKRRLDAGEDLVLVDVLSPESYRERHLPGAINLPVVDLDAETAAALPRDKDIIVYCASFECTASPWAAQKLEEMGFVRVFDFEGGLRDWIEAGYPLAPSAA